MALVRGKSFKNRRGAVEFFLRDRHLVIKPEVVEWFSYARIYFSESELKEKSYELVSKQVTKNFGRNAGWSMMAEFVPAPYYKFVTSSYPYYYDFSLDLYLVASVEVWWENDRSYGYYHDNCVVVDSIKKELEKFQLPLDFLQAISKGDLSQFPQKARDNQGYYTWNIPSLGRDIRLHTILFRNLESALRGKPLGPALVYWGLATWAEGQLAERTLLALPVVAGSLTTAGVTICQRDEVQSALTHGALGITVKKANEAIDAVFDPSSSLEDNLKHCLQYLGQHQ
jgi:hypothetical protein